MQTKEIDWLSTHSKEVEIYEGMWIAIVDDKIVGIGHTASEALNQAKEKGYTQDKPLITKVPRKDEGPYIL